MDYRNGIGSSLKFIVLYLLFINAQLICYVTSITITYPPTTTTTPLTTTTTTLTTTTTPLTTTTTPLKTTTTPLKTTTTPLTTTTTPLTTTTTPMTTTTTHSPATTTSRPTTTSTTKPITTTPQTTTTNSPPTSTTTPITTYHTTIPPPTTTTPLPATSTARQTTSTTLPAITTTTATTKQTTTTTPPSTTTIAPKTSTSVPTTTTRPTATSTDSQTLSKTTPARNYCSNNPCKNGGTCNTIGEKYECKCAGGYTNDSCEIEINECDTLPCYPFGDCLDKINNYSCVCRPGFKYVSDYYCSDTNECDVYEQLHPAEAVCLNDGTCNDIIDGFYCECKQTDEDLIVFGDRCEKNVSRYDYPILFGISKNKGIQAGGSALTFTGKGLDIIQPIGAYFNASAHGLDVLFGYLKSGSVQSRSFIVLTPKAPNDSYADLPLTISVLLSGGVIEHLSDSVTFTFVGNPTITDLEPKVILASGGIKLTVEGSNLDAVGTPQMAATLKQYTALNETGSTTTYPPQTCSVATNAKMTCQLPKFNLDDSSNEATTPIPAKRRKKRDFFSNLYSSLVKKAQDFYRSLVWNPVNPMLSEPHLLESPFSDERLLKRRRRDGDDSRSEKPVSTFFIDNQTYDLFLNFTLDNYPKYEDLSKSAPNITLTAIDSKPEFKAGANKVQTDFDPSKNEPLTIAGDRLLTGLSKDDYTVAVGVGSCVILSLSDNSMSCSPPAERPDVGNVSVIYCKNYPDHLAVVVTAVESDNFVCCIKYSSEDSGDTFLIIGLCVGIGGSLLLLITVVVSVVIARRRRCLKQSDGHPRSVPPHSTGNSHILTDYPNDDNNSHILGYDNNFHAGGSTYYGQAIGLSDAAGGDPDTRRMGPTTDGEPSYLTNIQRGPKFKPFGFHVRPGKRISWTRPTREGGMHEPNGRQREDNKPSSGKSKQSHLTGLRHESTDHHSNDYPNMRNFAQGSRNILHELNEEVNLDDRDDDPERHQTAFWSSDYNRYTSEPTMNDQNPLSDGDIDGYSRNIDEADNESGGKHLYGEVLKRQPESSETPTNDRMKIRRGNVKTYYPPAHD